MRDSTKYILLLWGFCFLLTLLTQNVPFFWDNVLLSSRVAYHFYEQGLLAFILPFELDCGHPPFIGVYIAAFWKVFGKTLAVAHWAMLPILLILSYHYFKVAQYFLPASMWIYACLFFILEPSLIAQCTMVSNDVVIIMGFFWCLSAILYQKYPQIILASLLMAIVSIRGAVMVFCVYVAGMAFYAIKEKRINWSLCLWFIPSALFFVGWNFYHQQQVGWMLAGQNPNWSGHYDYANLKEIVWNMVVVAKNFLDFGRIFLWIPLLIFLGIAVLKGQLTAKQKQLIGIFISSLLIFLMVILIRTNPIGHRYLVVYYIMSSLLFVSFFKITLFEKVKKWLIPLVSIGLITGNFWIYPAGMAQGWDATLGYLNYFEGRKAVYEYIETHQIPTERVGAGFTMYVPSRYIDLQERNDHFGYLIDEGWENFDYIFYSNIMNDFSDEELLDLKNNWKELISSCRLGVCCKLYQRKQ